MSNWLEARIIRRVPTAKQQTDIAWRATDRWTREVLREIGRLGYDVTSWTSDDDPPVGRVYLGHVGAKDLTMVLRVVPDGDDRIRVERVMCAPHSGHSGWTARQAALWLPKRASRERRYL